MIKIKWSQASLSKFKSGLLTKAKSIGTNAVPVMKMFAGQVMAESKAEIPIDTGAAQSTAYVNEPKVGNGFVSVTMGYAGEGHDTLNTLTGIMVSQYIIMLHETKGTNIGGGYYHPYGKWKFLEEPLKRNKQIFIETLRRSMQTTLNTGGIK